MSRRTITPETQAARTERLVAASNAWRDQLNPLRSLTMPIAINWLDQAQRGVYADLMWAYEVGIEPTNADLLCIRERSEAAIRDCDWTVKTIDPDTKGFDERLAEEQEAFLRGLWEGVENLSDAIAFLDGYRFRGFAHVSPWASESDPLLIKCLQPLDQWNLVRNGYRGAWHWNPKAQQVPASALPDGSLMDPSEYCVIETSRSVNRIALIGHVRATTAEKDWDAYVEIYGIPGCFVIMPENVGNNEVGQYLELAEKAAEQASGALPAGSNVITTQEARSNQPFQPRLEWIQRQIVMAGTGGLLSVLTESGSGTLAGSVHENAFRQIGRGVARRISEAFQRQIEKPRLAKAFPNRPVLAYIEIQPPEYRDQTQATNNVVALANAGYRMEAEEVSELTGLEVTDYGPPGQASVPAEAKMRARQASPEQQPEQPAVLTEMQATFARLEEMARDPAVSDADLQAAAKAAAESFPELLQDLMEAIARPMAMDMAKAAVDGAGEGMQP